MPNYSKLLKTKKRFEINSSPTDLSDEISSEVAIIELKSLRKKLAKIQDIMYAHNKYNVLICFQGMDTAGKDSLIRELFKEFNARGVEVNSFKTPSPKELQHDYLWRHYCALPARGKFGVFNRTHYENVLVTRVHPEYLLHENLPFILDLKDLPKDLWKERYAQINNFEKQLTANGTIIFKFYLHLSKGEQKKRLLRRLEKEKHNWKFSPGDLAERKLWDKYMVAYEEAIQQTSKSNAPWYCIPADDKDITRYLVAKIIYDKLKTYTDIQYPTLDDAIQEDIKKYKTELESET